MHFFFATIMHNYIAVDTDRVMVTWNRRAMYPGTMSQWFPKFLRDNELDYLNYHGLRHTFATLMDRSDISDVDLSRLLGHTKVSTTKNLYTHALPGADYLAASTMQNLIKPNENEALPPTGTQNGTRSS
jgi:integrase